MEQKKLLGILISVGVFLVIVAAAGLFIFYPKNAKNQTTQAKSMPAKVVTTDSGIAIEEPDEWVRKPEALPGLEPAKSLDQAGKAQTEGKAGDMVVVYGEKPPVSASEQGGAANPTASLRDGNLTVNVSVQPAPNPSQAEASKRPVAQSKPKTEAKSAAEKAQTKASATMKAEPKKVQVSEYWIQAGSFKSRAKADETKQILAKKGLVAVVTTFDLDGASYYRVRIGPYPSQPEANGWLAQLKAIVGFEQSYVSKVASAKTAN